MGAAVREPNETDPADEGDVKELETLFAKEVYVAGSGEMFVKMIGQELWSSDVARSTHREADVELFVGPTSSRMKFEVSVFRMPRQGKQYVVWAVPQFFASLNVLGRKGWPSVWISKSIER